MDRKAKVGRVKIPTLKNGSDTSEDVYIDVFTPFVHYFRQLRRALTRSQTAPTATSQMLSTSKTPNIFRGAAEKITRRVELVRTTPVGTTRMLTESHSCIPWSTRPPTRAPAISHAPTPAPGTTPSPSPFTVDEAIDITEHEDRRQKHLQYPGPRTIILSSFLLIPTT